MESRYYISSLDSDAKRLFQATRSHWGHREQCPLVLDLSIREGESRAGVGHSAEYLAIVRYMALNLLR